MTFFDMWYHHANKSPAERDPTVDNVPWEWLTATNNLLFFFVGSCLTDRLLLRQIQAQQLSDFIETSAGMAAGPVDTVTFRAFLKTIVYLENIIRHPAPDVSFSHEDDRGIALQTPRKWPSLRNFYTQFTENLF